jgi:lysozyme
MRNKYIKVLLPIFVAILVLVTLWFNIQGCIFRSSQQIEEEAGSSKTEEETITVYGDYIPVDTSVDKNEYDPALFSKSDDGRITYNSETAKSGVDVSSYQGDIDWAQVSESGMDFAIIRMGYRGYGSGSLNTDEMFHTNVTGALESGMDVGVYFFSQAINESEARQEAEYVLEAVKDYDIKYPIVFDWEYITDDDARTDDIPQSVVTDCAIAFCETVKEAGYTPAIYFNVDLGYTEYEIGRIAEYTLWLAEYADIPTFYYEFHIWQYTNSGTVPGISTPADINISFDDYGSQ